jgi:hypothetical protein
MKRTDASFVAPVNGVMELEMRSQSFIGIAALSLAALVATFATATVPIEGHHSRVGLEGICDAIGGKSYGSVGKAYGCSKGTVTVECLRDDACTGYVYFRMASARPSTGDPAVLLRHRSAPEPATIRTAGDMPIQE